MSKLTPEMQLEISKAVEDRLGHLPAETLKVIQGEVDERVKQTEEHYLNLMATWTSRR